MFYYDRQIVIPGDVRIDDANILLYVHVDRFMKNNIIFHRASDYQSCRDFCQNLSSKLEKIFKDEFYPMRVYFCMNSSTIEFYLIINNYYKFILVKSYA